MIQIDPRGMHPNVIIPEYMPSPKHVHICNLTKSKKWVWDGNNVTLIRPLLAAGRPRLIKEALTWLEDGYDRGLRALNAAEMMQIVGTDLRDPPSHWKEAATGGRIFWTGSIYRLVHVDESVCDMVAYCWFEDDEWRSAYIEERAPLRPGDEFAVVARNPGDMIADSVPLTTSAYMRRVRYRPRYRQ